MMRGLLTRAAAALAVLLLVAACSSPTGDDKGGTVTVTGVSVFPASVTVNKGGTQQFSATVEGIGSPAQAVTWAIVGAAAYGTAIDGSGLLTLAAGETAMSLTVRATSTADGSKSGRAAVAVGEPARVTSVTVSPANPTVYKGGMQQFSATVAGTGSPAQAVTWAVTGAAASGTAIDGSGFLTVATGETATSLTVRATSALDGSKSGTATVTVAANAFPTPEKYREMVSLPGGTVTGSDSYAYQDEYGGIWEGVFIAGRTVTLSPFRIAKYETTYELWKEVYDWGAARGYVMNPGREGHGGTEGTSSASWTAEQKRTRPVTEISWRDAVIWCNAYSEMSGKTPVYYTDTGYGTVLKTTINDSIYNNGADFAVMKPGANGYRLPTEAEWEYAARGGNPGNAAWGYDHAGSNTIGEVAWYGANSYELTTALRDYGPHPVGTRAANTAGLYDMSGNVMDWCWDWREDLLGTGAATDPLGVGGALPGSNHRVVRGGSWGHGAAGCAVAYRSGADPGGRHFYLGFRVVSP
ncbi:MAG: SUMF1/EgtB/PvdO family nonheme iron enzyme [Spirochaetaceae bacterium]|jgi:formylglycine-generating enzyme required for sulfatase activity|nr:SUMF1/EgtB/PvdO family nonheme iron enzyme [Spirochaetaceae bacterium]